MDFQTYLDICALLQRSSVILDSNDLAAWPQLFIEDGQYRLQSRENHDAGHPLAIMHYESRGMMQDRIYGVQETIYHDPYTQCHVCSAPAFTQLGQAQIECTSSFIVTRVQRSKMPETLAVGHYQDVLVQTGEGWRFGQRHAIYDNDLLPNSVIKPI